MPSLKISAHATRVLLLAVLSIGASGQAPHAAPGDVLPFTATERTLANGLKIIVVPTGFPNLVSVQIPVQTGSRNEVEPGKSGFAHFFEHLMFRGTPANPPEKYREIMGKSGARDNASTGDDYTQYYATFAKEHLEQVIALYADMFQNLAYSEADFKTEARAILGEYNKNSANPIQKLLEVQRDTYYRAHTYKHTTMGFITDIENMPNEYTLLEGVLRAVVPATEHGDRDRGGRDARSGPAARRETLGRMETGRRGHSDSERAAPRRPAVRPRAMGERDAAVCDRRLPRSCLRRDEQGLGRDGHPRGPLLRLDIRAVQEARRQRAESRCPRCRCSVQRRSLALHDICTGQESGRRSLRSGSDPGHDFQRSRGADSRAAPDRRKVIQPVRIRPVARQHRAHRHDGGGVRVLSPIVRHGERLFPDARDPYAGGSAVYGAQVLHRRRPDRHDPLEGFAPHRHRARSLPGSSSRPRPLSLRRL